MSEIAPPQKKIAPRVSDMMGPVLSQESKMNIRLRPLNCSS